MDAGVRERAFSLLKVLVTVRRLKQDSVPVAVAGDSGLFLGSIGAAYNREKLLSLGITHVLCVACDLPQPYPCDFVYQRVLIQDSCDAPLHTHFESCFQFIQSGLEAGGGVLVHCFAGRSRSATVVAAWLMCTHHLTMLEALAMVHAVRPQASPNAGFMRQLAAFEEQEHGSRSCLTRANSRLCACAPSQA